MGDEMAKKKAAKKKIAAGSKPAPIKKKIPTGGKRTAAKKAAPTKKAVTKKKKSAAKRKKKSAPKEKKAYTPAPLPENPTEFWGSEIDSDYQEHIIVPAVPAASIDGVRITPGVRGSK